VHGAQVAPMFNTAGGGSILIAALVPPPGNGPFGPPPSRGHPRLRAGSRCGHPGQPASMLSRDHAAPTSSPRPAPHLTARAHAHGLVSFVVRGFSTNSRPALRAAGGRPPARRRHDGHRRAASPTIQARSDHHGAGAVDRRRPTPGRTIEQLLMGLLVQPGSTRNGQDTLGRGALTESYQKQQMFQAVSYPR
jgi:hypothetical protein